MMMLRIYLYNDVLDSHDGAHMAELIFCSMTNKKLTNFSSEEKRIKMLVTYE